MERVEFYCEKCGEFKTAEDTILNEQLHDADFYEKRFKGLEQKLYVCVSCGSVLGRTTRKIKK